MAKPDFDIIIIGGGIVGLASAWKIGLAHSGVSIAVVEKESQLAAHQTGRNSGVIHSGLYYKPGSQKAKTCAAGRKQLVEFAKAHNIAHDICGKIIVATDEKELPALERVYNNGLANGIEGIEKITAERIKEIEPCSAGIAGICVPCTGIIDFKAVVEKLADLVRRQGSQVFTGHKVTAIETKPFGKNIVTSHGTMSCKYLVNCGGLWCDKIAKMDGLKPVVRIIPFRGDYYQLTESAIGKVKALIYPVPDSTFPFLGVHFTRMVDGSVECGPNAVFSFKREGYTKTSFSLADTFDSLSYPGTWILFAKHWRFGLAEYARAFSKKRFLKQLQRLIPSLQPTEIIPAKAGVRAQALGRGGQLVDDFKIETTANAIHVLNAPSPAATASLAIGEYINNIADEHFKLKD